MEDRLKEKVGWGGVKRKGNNVKKELSIRSWMEDREGRNKMFEKSNEIGEIEVMGNGDEEELKLRKKRM